MNQYIQIMESYEVNKKATEDILKNNGFNRNGIFKCFVYKDILQLIVKVDVENLWWDYQVFNTNAQLIYPPYYNKDSGVHREVEEVEIKIKEIIKHLLKAKILKKAGGKNEKVKS